MPQAIRYCDKCGKMIQVGDGSFAHALVTARFALCPACAARLTPEQRARLAAAAAAPAAAGPALPRITPPPRRAAVPPRHQGEIEVSEPDFDLDEDSEPAAPSRRPLTRAMRLAQRAEQGPTSPAQRNAVMMAVGAGAVVAIAVLLGLILRGPAKPQDAGGPGGGAKAAPAKSEYALMIEIGEKLRKLKAAAQASPSAYEKTRPALLKFVTDHRGRQEAEAAMQFVKYMDAEYEQITGKRIGP